MSRTQKSYTIVSIEAGKFVTSHYANVDALKDAIGKNFVTGQHDFLVYEGSNVELSIEVEPRITIGGIKARKPRGPNKKKAHKMIDAKPANGHKTLPGNVIDEHL